METAQAEIKKKNLTQSDLRIWLFKIKDTK